MVVRWTLRAGGLREVGLHQGGILGKFQLCNLLGALALVAKCCLFHSLLTLASANLCPKEHWL